MLQSVLLVDDDSTTNFLNKLLLTKTMQVAREVRVAENGEAALRLLYECCGPAEAAGFPQLLLLDMNMPVMNGLDFLEAYFALPPAWYQHTVVVILTTSLHPQDQARVQQLPIAGFLNKPLTREKVATLLQEYFSPA